MQLSLARDDFKCFVGRQLDTFYPDGASFDDSSVDAAFDQALERSEHCFSHITVPGYVDADGQVLFNHLHSDQYAQFLYFFGNSLWKQGGDKAISDKSALLNKTLHGLWCSYKLALPEIFLVSHPVGTVLGHAEYSEYLLVHQNVTVNTDPGLVFGKGVTLSAGCTIVGAGRIGDWTSIGANALVLNPDIPDHSVAFAGPSGLAIKPRSRPSLAQRSFDIALDAR